MNINISKYLISIYVFFTLMSAVLLLRPSSDSLMWCAFCIACIFRCTRVPSAPILFPISVVMVHISSVEVLTSCIAVQCFSLYQPQSQISNKLIAVALAIARREVISFTYPLMFVNIIQYNWNDLNFMFCEISGWLFLALTIIMTFVLALFNWNP